MDNMYNIYNMYNMYISVPEHCTSLLK